MLTLPLRYRLAVQLLAGTLLPLPNVAAQYFPQDRDLTFMLRYLVEDGETSGIVLGLLEADGSTRVVSYGIAGADARPLGARTVFEIGSISKTFTGLLLADMVARMEVALADPISKYLPSGVSAPSRSGREITLLDLATHHSGLPRLPDNHVPANPADPYADFTVEKLYAFLAKHQLRRDPGAEGEYSNLGFGLLGHLLARAAGTTYEDLVEKRILGPLGMSLTGYSLKGNVADWMSKGHDAKGNVVPFWFGTDAIHGAGGLRSSVEDMLKYLKANVGPPTTGLQRAMHDAHEVQKRINAQTAIGLGWQMTQYQGRTLLVHGGGTGGFNGYIGFDPEKRVGFVMLTNTGQFQDDLGMHFLRRGPPLSAPIVNVSRDVLARYVGTYAIAPDQKLFVRLEADSTLTVQVPGNVRSRLYAQSDTAFFLKRVPWRVTFTRDDTGAVTRIVVDLDGMQRMASRESDTTPPAWKVAGNEPPAGRKR